MAEDNLDDLRAMLREKVPTAVATLREIAANPDNSAALRRKAQRLLREHGFD